MCKFHKDVAKDIATNPVTGEFNPGQYAVALVAMAKFRIEQYMPPMHGCDGFVPSQMTSPVALQALTDSKLVKPLTDFTAYRDANIAQVRAAMAATAQTFDLSLSALNTQDRITKEGYKKTCCADPDPTKNGPFLDEAVVDLFEGYDRPGYVSGDLSLLKTAHKPQFEPIRAATEHFMAQPGVDAILKQMFENSLASVFINAKDDLAAGRGHDKTDGCVMCHDKADEPKAATATAPTLKDRMKTAFKRCAGDGFVGFVSAHAGCLAMPVAMGVFGAAAHGVSILLSPVLAGGLTYAWNKARGTAVTPLKIATSAVMGLTFSIAMNMGGCHGGHEGHDNRPNGMDPTMRVVPGGTLPPCGGTGGACCGGQRLQPAQP